MKRMMQLKIQYDTYDAILVEHSLKPKTFRRVMRKSDKQ